MGSRSAVQATKAMVVVVAVIAGAIASAGPAAATPCVDVFDPAFRQSIASDFPTQRVTAAVYDTRTGCWHHLNQGMRIETASVIKAQFLAGVLLRAQDQRRGLNSFELGRLAPMIAFSFNPEASDLFSSLGGVSGMNTIDRRFGLTSTTHTSKWGKTVSTAEDRTRLALSMLHSGGPLNANSRALANLYMSFIHGSQQWGITAGVPDGWPVALKNGFFPTTGTAAWRIGSTGFVRDDITGEGYAVTIMTDRNPNHVSGQGLVETVSRRIATVLTSGDSANRLVDRSRCVTAGSGESWSQVAARIGASDVGGTKTASGGTPNPIGGMRACAPDFRAPPGPNPRSTIDGIHTPIRGDFNGDGRADIFWYRPGPGGDEIWTGNADATFARVPIGVSGRYQPITGDFNGDTTTDIYWYRPGTAPDYLWTGNIGGGFTNTQRNVNGNYDATVADLNGDGRDDIVWNAPGAGADSSWTAISDTIPAFSSRPESIPGFQRPVVGDLDGDPEVEVLFYGPGSETDLLFDGTERTLRPVLGRYEPLSGDFNGDSRGDIVFYGRGGASDAMWLGTTNANAPLPVQPTAS